MARRRKNPLTAFLTRPSPADVGAHRSQATVLTWDADTNENTISWRGEVYTNMSFLTTGSVDYAGGDIVILEGWAPEGKLSSWYILGKVVKPPLAAPEES